MMVELRYRVGEQALADWVSFYLAAPDNARGRVCHGLDKETLTAIVVLHIDGIEDVGLRLDDGPPLVEFLLQRYAADTIGLCRCIMQAVEDGLAERSRLH